MTEALENIRLIKTAIVFLALIGGFSLGQLLLLYAIWRKR